MTIPTPSVRSQWATSDLNKLADAVAELQTVGTPDLALTARGMVAENYPIALVSNSAALTSQTVFAGLVGLRAGRVVTSIVFDVTTQAAGTAPTNAYVALYSSAGVRLAVSADIAGSAIWSAATGPVAAPLSAPYTVLADGGYYAAILVNGTWSVTQVAVGRVAPNGEAGKALSGFVGIHADQTGQTSMPATATLVAAAGACFWFGVA